MENSQLRVISGHMASFYGRSIVMDSSHIMGNLFLKQTYTCFINGSLIAMRYWLKMV